MIETDNRVYLVEDDESVRRALKRLLGASGFQVTAFASADEFLDAVPIDAMGCVVLDIHMPGMDGFQLQHRLNSLGSRLPTIFITADRDAELGERALKAGAQGLLKKPFNDESLINMVRAALERHGNARLAGSNPAG